MAKNPKILMIFLLSASLVTGAALMGGCVGKEIETPPQQTPTQIIEDITPQEAYTLIQENQENPDFVILDVRTPAEFAEGYIEDAINIDSRSETFADELDQLDKSKTYLTYCRSGRLGEKVLPIMEELGFREVYNMTGGIIQWMIEGLPTIQQTTTQTIKDITAQEAFTLVQQNQNNPDFVIIDLDSSERFARGHIENAINIDYNSKTIRDNLDPLDRNKAYLVYCRCSGRGVAGRTADIMAELDFREVYALLGGLSQWKTEGFPTTQ